MNYENSLFWLRRDLRLTDNKALFSACEQSKQVFLVFIFDTNILNKLSNKKDKRVEFIFKAIQSINEQLKKQKIQVIVLNGDPTKLVPDLCKNLNISAVFANEDYESYAKKRDQQVKQKLKQKKINFHSFKDHVIFGSDIKKPDGSPYRVFTPYKKAWLKKLKSKNDLKEYKADLKKLNNLNNKKQKELNLTSLGFKETNSNIEAGEKTAQKQLKQFTKFIKKYHKNRDYPHLNKTSGLSVHLRFGTLSIRSCVRLALKNKSQGNKIWLSELIWRDFYSMILDEFPYVEKNSLFKKVPKFKLELFQKKISSLV